MKRMLINATQPEELRVALVDGQWLYDLDIENRNREQKKANIYKGKITRVEPSLEAAFVDYGAERHGFLPLKEISREYFSKAPNDVEGRIKIKEVVKEGTEVIVQVDKEERGNKGAALTTFVSLAGRYLVLMPNNPRAGGISRRIEGEDRAQLKDALSGVEIPSGMGIIIRTAGVGRSAEELQWDLNYLLQLWESIDKAAKSAPAPNFLFQESNVIIRAIRDYLRQDVGEVIVDNKEAFDLANGFIQQVMPNFGSKVKLYNDDIPLFNRYQIESQIETAFQREVKLPSGGSIVIDVTEALVSIDINSSRATKGGDIEETALQTNLEAADEIARQLRLRDMGGLIVIDFIDMQPARNQREVENRMRDALNMDRARVQVGRISRFGLLEMSRQRLRPSLGEVHSKVCPRCNGQGTIRSTRSLALSILRLVEEEAQKERSAEIRAIAPVSVATYLLNEKRKTISNIEQRNSTRVVVVPNADMMTPHFEVQRLRDDDEGTLETSYKIVATADEHSEEEVETSSKPAPLPQPAVQPAAPTEAAPTPVAPKEPSLWERFVALLAGLFKGNEEDKKSSSSKGRGHQRSRHSRGGNQNRRREGGNRNRRGGRRDERGNQRDGDSRPEKRQDKAADKASDNSQDKGQEKNTEGNSGRRSRGGRNRRGGAGNKPETRGDNSQPKDASPQKAEAAEVNEPAQEQATNEQQENRPPKRPAGRRTRSGPRRRNRRELPEEVIEKANEIQAANQDTTDNVKAERSNRANRDQKAGSEARSDNATDDKPAKADTLARRTDTGPVTAQADTDQSEEREARRTRGNTEARNTATTEEPQSPKDADAEATIKPTATAELREEAPRRVSQRQVGEPRPTQDAAAPKVDTAESSTTKSDTKAAQNATDTEAPQGRSVTDAGSAETDAEVSAKAVQPATPEPVAEPANTAAPAEPAAPEENALAEDEASKESVTADTQEPTTAEAPAATAEPAEAPAAPAEETQEVSAPTPEPAPRSSARATNDPRLAPQPKVPTEIVTEHRQRSAAQALDTRQPPAVSHNPRPLARPANDPRNRQAPEVESSASE
ncbi:RNAse E [Marinimicrobium koreense]|uniref:Ribonuclease E n=1 Tax=Marinimicrobium koreense TaxID=306545 RepID=A0A3N1NXV0_9GAMM|nr:ribonuclease E [Marinimicrobium koreense]ROQ20241.1 RNAse E [Marinimicrobium koreense]